MKLLDSNIIIYSPYPEYSYLRDLVDNESNCVSAPRMIDWSFYQKLFAFKQKLFNFKHPH